MDEVRMKVEPSSCADMEKWQKIKINNIPSHKLEEREHGYWDGQTENSAGVPLGIEPKPRAYCKAPCALTTKLSYRGS